MDPIDGIDLPTHERHSQARADAILSKLNQMGDNMSEGTSIKDKVDVNIFGDTGKGGNMDGIWASVLPALAAEGRRGGSDCRDGGFGMLGAAALGFFAGEFMNGRRGGRGGEGGEGGRAETRIEDTIFDTQILAKLGSIEASIPASECRTQAAVASAAAGLTNVTLQQTIALERDLASLALGTQQAFANTKDTVQNVGALLGTAICNLNQNVSAQGCQTREAIQNDGDKTRGMLFSRFQLEDSTRINELNARVIELQSEGRRAADGAEMRLSINNTANAVQAQAQGQAQQQQQQQGFLLAQIAQTLGGLVQVAHATNSNVIAGNSGAVVTGPQTANPTNVA
jgi:hypothetical protein